MKSTLALAAVALALLAACATPPKPTTLPPVLSDQSLGLQGETAQPAPSQWWHSFNDPQLDRLIDTALHDSPDLGEANSRLHQALAQAEAAHAGQLPTARLSAGETRLKIPGGFPAAIDGGHSVWAGDLGAVLSWDLDLWGLHAAQTGNSRDLSRAASMDVERARLLLAGSVAQAYVEFNHSYALEDIAARAEAQRQNIVEIARQRVAAGLDTRVELREAEGAVPQAHLTLLQAQAAEEQSRHQLSALSGHGADGYAAIARPQLDLQAALSVPGQLPINLLERRPDVLAARWRIAAADQQRHAAKAAFYPNISLTALVGYASFSVKDLLSAQSFGYGAGPALSLPLFDGGRLRAQYQGSEAELESAVGAYDDTVLRAVRQAADQLTLIDALKNEQTQQQQWQDAAEEAYRLDQERYQNGLASYLSVLNAETEVLSARRQGSDLQAALATARISLLLALGGDFQNNDSIPTVAAR